jgi:hypothetical protein
MNSDPATVVEPGDCLIYRPSTIFGWIIAVKTWNRFSHVEAYFGRTWSIGARQKGVNYYPFDVEHLARVMRPKRRFDMPKAMLWFKGVVGQKYDYLGLLCFTLAVRQGDQNKMFCSEWMTRWYRSGGFEPFQPEVDADHVAPAQFAQCPLFYVVWDDGQPPN